MRGGTSESGTSSSRRSEAKAARSSSVAAEKMAAAAAMAASNKPSGQNIQNALSFGDHLQFMTMPVSLPIYRRV